PSEIIPGPVDGIQWRNAWRVVQRSGSDLRQRDWLIGFHRNRYRIEFERSKPSGGIPAGRDADDVNAGSRSGQCFFDGQAVPRREAADIAGRHANYITVLS